jgi:hypothetical protein
LGERLVYRFFKRAISQLLLQSGEVFGHCSRSHSRGL